MADSRSMTFTRRLHPKKREEALALAFVFLLQGVDDHRLQGFHALPIAACKFLQEIGQRPMVVVRKVPRKYPPSAHCAIPM